MWTQKFFQIGVIGVCLLAMACVEYGPEFEPLDEATSEIKLNRQAGVYDCSTVPDIGRVEITNSSDGIVLEANSLSLGDPEDERCAHAEEYGYQCVISEPIEPAQLSKEEFAQVRDVISDIPQKDCAEDPDRICHPCRINVITVDGHSVDDYCCGELNDEFRSGFERAVQKLESTARQNRNWEFE